MLKEKYLTSDFRFGFEFEAIGMNYSSPSAVQEQAESVFGSNNVDMHEDPSIKVDQSDADECPSCYGRGTRECYNCEGSGSITEECQECGGSGTIHNSETEEDEECSVCGGTGRAETECSVCYGRGYENCEDCEGTGVSQQNSDRTFELAIGGNTGMPFRVSEIVKSIDFLMETLENEAYTNESCGFHVHLSFPNLTKLDLIWAVINMSLDPEALQMFSVFSFPYKGGKNTLLFDTSYSEIEPMADSAQGLFSAVKDAKEYPNAHPREKIAEQLKTNLEKIQNKYNFIRIHTIGTLEWRGPRDFLDYRNREVIIEFFKLLYKFVRYIASTKDVKEIQGVSKEDIKQAFIDYDVIFSEYDKTKKKDVSEVSSIYLRGKFYTDFFVKNMTREIFGAITWTIGRHFDDVVRMTPEDVAKINQYLKVWKYVKDNRMLNAWFEAHGSDRRASNDVEEMINYADMIQKNMDRYNNLLNTQRKGE